MKLRPYQIEDIQAIKNAWIDNRAVLYQLPTGGGKSVILTQLIEDCKSERIVIFAHRRRLLYQLRDHLSNIGITAGLLIGGISENLDSNIIIVSIHTAVQDARLERLLKRKWNTVVVDEAHHTRSNSYDKVLKAILDEHKACKLLGVSATPYRKDKRRLDEHFEILVQSSETTASLIEKGFLAPYRTYVSPIGHIEEEVEEVANDFQQQQLSQYMRQQVYLDYVVDTYMRYGENRQAIIFAVDKEHAKELKRAFVEKGIVSIKRIDSSMKDDEVERVITSYEKKEIKILINIEMLTEGVDLPDTGCIIGARPTKSLVLYLQMVGRGTRLKSDRSDLIVLDCSGWTDEFGQLSSSKHWSLNPSIDPNRPRLRNKVLGIQEDGSYTDTLDDFIGEVVELTPEEYLNTVADSLEDAKKINEKIEKQIDDTIHETIRLLLDQMQRFDKTLSIDEYSYQISSWRKEVIEFSYGPMSEKRYSKATATLELTNKHRLFMAMTHVSSSKEESYLVEAMKMYSFVGVCNTMLLRKPQNEIQLLELHERILDLYSSQIDIDNIKATASQFKEDEWQREVNEYCSNNDGLFTLPNAVNYSAFFKGSYSFEVIDAFRVIGGKINSWSNEIELIMSNKWRRDEKKTEVKKFQKAERIYEILKRAKWEKK